MNEGSTVLSNNLTSNKAQAGRDPGAAITELRHSYATQNQAYDYTPSKDEYKKAIDLKDLDESGNPNLVKFGGQYFEIP